jgi:hypothetical protein
MNADSKSNGILKRDKLKKPYAKPEVLNYGAIHEITQATGNKGRKDGGSGTASKTQS